MQSYDFLKLLTVFQKVQQLVKEVLKDFFYKLNCGAALPPLRIRVYVQRFFTRP